MRPFFGQTNYRFALKISPFSYQLPSLFSGLEENKKTQELHQTAKRGYREFPSRSEMLDFRLNLKPMQEKYIKYFHEKISRGCGFKYKAHLEKDAKEV